MSRPLRIVFMGTPEFSSSFLKALLNSEHQVVAVATQPDRPAGRGRQLSPPPVKICAEAAGIPVFQPENLRDEEFAAQLRALDVDLFVVVAYSILPKSLLEIPRLGSVNVHTSLLPKYRGAAPVQHALLAGETEVGMSIFLLDEKMDHGPLVSQWRTAVDPQDHYGEIMQRFEDAGPEFLVQTLVKLSGDFEPLVQDHSAACGAPKLRKEDGLLDFSLDRHTVYNRIRALSAWPVAYAYLDGKALRIPRAGSQTMDLGDAPVGSLKSPDQKSLWVRCQDSWLELLRVTPEGRKEMNGADFWRGLQQKEGVCLKKQA